MFIIVLFGISLAIILISCSNNGISSRIDSIPHLYSYNEEEILNYIQKSGYQKYSLDSIARNSTGTTLYINIANKGNIVLSISQGGKIKALIPPSRRAYMNDKEEFVAWINIKGEINFKNGYIRTSPMLGKVFNDFDTDPSGKYYFIKTEPQLIQLASTSEPEKILFETNFEAEKIFTKNEKVYVFSRDYRNIRGPGDYEQHEILCQVLRKVDSKLEIEEEIHIPRQKPRPSPFAVIDMDTWSDNVYIVDVRDVPFSFLTSGYLFNSTFALGYFVTVC